MMNQKNQGGQARYLEAFFTKRLIQERRASQHTVASYRDTFRLLLRFARDQLKKNPSDLELADLDCGFLSQFLSHLEAVRGNGVRSRNVRLAAIHSFFQFVALEEPGASGLAQRVLSIPTKKADRRPVGYLTRLEVDALLAAPDVTTRAGRRDYALLLLALQTGLRVSEIAQLKRDDVHFGTGAHVRCVGKGRKHRCTPLQAQAVQALKTWLGEHVGPSTDPLFPSSRGLPLTPDGIRYILAKHLAPAIAACPTLAKKRVTPHVLRHTLAVGLLESGVDEAVIALWLGHESVDTTRIYLHSSRRSKKRPWLESSPTMFDRSSTVRRTSSSSSLRGCDYVEHTTAASP